MLRQNNTLTSISLKKYSFGDHGANEIAVALRDNTALETLDVSSNNIGRDGAASFGEALKVNRTLRRLNLDHNGIQDEGLLALVNSLLQVCCIAQPPVFGLRLDGLVLGVSAVRVASPLQACSPYWWNLPID